MARRKNGKFTRQTKTRRRYKPKLNLVDTGVSLIIANSVTQGLANASLMDFITGRKDGKYMARRDGTYRLTIPELLTGVTTWEGFEGGTPAIIARNFKKNGWSMLGTVFLAPVVANVAKKVLKKPFAQLNKVIKTTGLDVKV